MKKILRLVTTSVLTLTLVACGEASSSVSNGTNTSSSVASSISAFANVTSVTLSAASDTLTQTLGTQKTVVVQATLNSGTNPSAALEWFVNGTKSNQTGRVFEYTPSTSGTFKIQARVGSVSSNELTLTVGSGTLTITKLTVVDNNTIRVQAPGGAQVTLTNNVLLPESKYDLKTGEYVLELETALTQGQSTTVTLTRDGSSVSQVAIFDTRVLEVSGVSGPAGTVTDNKDGTFDVLRPHNLITVIGTGDVTNTTNATYTTSFVATNMMTNSTSFTFENLSAPAGVALRPSFTSSTNIAGQTKSAAGQFTFTLNKDSTPGAYVYKFTVGGVTRNVTINVKDPTPIVDFVQYQYTGIAPNTNVYFASEAARGSNARASTQKFDILSAVNNTTFNVGLTLGTDGTYAITKPYVRNAEQFKSFKFKLSGKFFDVPTNVMDQAGINSNQLQISVASPDGLPIMRTQFKPGGQEALPVLTGGFRSGFTSLPDIVQHLDAATPAGIYTYTVRVLQAGVESYNRQIKIKVVEPVAALSLLGYKNDATTSWETATSNVLETLGFPEFTADVITFNLANPVIKGADNADLVEENYNELRSLFLNKFRTSVMPKIGGFDVTTYESAKSAFISKFLNADGSVKTTADSETDLRKMFSPYALNAGATNFDAAETDPEQNLSDLLVTTVLTNYLLILDSLVDSVIFEYNDVSETKIVEGSTVSIDLDDPSDERLENIGALFPTYSDWISSGRTSVTVGADGVFEIEKPLTQALDTKNIMFDLRISNYESPVSTGTDLSNQFNGTNPTTGTQARKELLVFNKAVSGPGLLTNNSFNTEDTKIALELGVGTVDTDLVEVEQVEDEVDNLAQPNPTSFRQYTVPALIGARTVGLARYDIANVFALDTRFLTVNGEYTFSVTVGALTQSVKVRIVSAKPDITLELDEDNSDFVLNETDGKYYGYFGYEGDELVADFNLTIKNIALPNNGRLAYNLVKKFPLKTETFVNTFEAVGANTGTNVNNGNLVVNPGDPDANPIKPADPFLSLLEPDTGVFEISTFGEYVFELTVAGVKKTLTIVAEKYPTIEITEINNGTDIMGSFFDEATEETVYVATESFETIVIQGKAVSLPANVYYQVDYDDSSDPDSSDDSFTVTLAQKLADRLTAEGYTKLDLTTGITVELFNGEDGLLDGSGIDKGEYVYLNVYLFSLNLDSVTSTPILASYDLTLLGHLSIKVWYLGEDSFDLYADEIDLED